MNGADANGNTAIGYGTDSAWLLDPLGSETKFGADYIMPIPSQQDSTTTMVTLWRCLTTTQDQTARLLLVSPQAGSLFLVLNFWMTLPARLEKQFQASHSKQVIE